MSAKLSYIRPLLGEVCGPYPGESRVMYFRNTHPKKKIKVFIRLWWETDGVRHQKEPYATPILEPCTSINFDEIHELDYKAGCLIPGPTRQRFNFEAYHAVLA